MPAETFNNAPYKPDRASVNAGRGYNNDTYLHELCERGAPASYIRDALAMGADINILNKQSLPPIAHAIRSGNADTVKAMLEAGAEIYFELPRIGNADPKFFNAAHYAAAYGGREKLEIILKAGGAAHVNSPGIDGDGYDTKMTPLHAAINKWKYDSIQPLVDAGAFVDAESGHARNTPLLAAVANDSEEAVLRLLKAGASLEHRHPTNGDTPLLLAASLDKRWVTQKLLALGADVEALNNKGQNALMLAASQGNAKVVEEILKQPAARRNIDLKDAEGMTALMHAAARGSSDAVTALLKAGADPMLSDKFNKTARAHADVANANSRSYRGHYDYDYNPNRGNSHSAAWILEEAEKSALHRQFEKTYDAMKKKSNGSKGPRP